MFFHSIRELPVCGRVILEKLQPIIYNEEEMCYHALGEKVADAFRTGAALKKSLE